MVLGRMGLSPGTADLFDGCEGRMASCAKRALILEDAGLVVVIELVPFNCGESFCDPLLLALNDFLTVARRASNSSMFSAKS